MFSSPPSTPATSSSTLHTQASQDPIFSTSRRWKTPCPIAFEPSSALWPQVKKKISVEQLTAATERLFRYTPRQWQVKVALKILEGHDVIVVAGTGAGKSLIFAMVAIAAALASFKGVVVVICPLKALQLDQVCGNLWKPDKNLPIDTRSNDSMKFANQQMKMTHKCPESLPPPSTKTIRTVTHSKKWILTKLAFAMQSQSACFKTPLSRSASETRRSENASL